MKRLITVKLTKEEAGGIMDAGNRGIWDLYDADGDEDHESANNAKTALEKIGRAMEEAWPEKTA